MSTPKQHSKSFVYNFEDNKRRAKWVLSFLLHNDVHNVEISYSGKYAKDIVSVNGYSFICNNHDMLKNKVQKVEHDELIEIFETKAVVVCAFSVRDEKIRNCYIHFNKMDTKILIECNSTETSYLLENILQSFE